MALCGRLATLKVRRAQPRRTRRPAQDPLADLEQLRGLVRLGSRSGSPPSGRVGGRAGLVAALAQGVHVRARGRRRRARPASSASSASRPTRSCSAASRSRPASRSARARSSSVSQASQPLAAAEHGGDPFLRAQLFLAPPPPRGPPAPDVDLAGRAEARRRRSPRRCRSRSAPRPRAPAASVVRVGVGGGHRLRVQGAVQQLDRRRRPATSTRLLGLGRLVEPARRPRASSSNGAKARIAVARASGSAGGAAARRRALRPAPAPARARGGAPSVCTTRTLSSPPSLAPRQVAAVGERQGPGEVELGESEELGQGRILRRRLSLRRASGCRFAGRVLPASSSGSEYFEGSIGTSGFSIWPRRSIRRCHWSGFSSGRELRFERVAGVDRAVADVDVVVVVGQRRS